MKKILVLIAVCALTGTASQAKIHSLKEKAKQQAIYNRVQSRLLFPANAVAAEAEMVAEDTADALVSE